MRYVKFNFIDNNFGEKTECILVWDDDSFILITVFGDRITIKEYKCVEEVFEELITAKNELSIFKDISKQQKKKL